MNGSCVKPSVIAVARGYGRHGVHGKQTKNISLSVGRLVRMTLLATTCFAFASTASHAESIMDALSRAYAGNPDLNAQRAAVRAQDENIPRARAGYLPKVSATTDTGYQMYDYKSQPYQKYNDTKSFPRGAGLSVTETLWNGNRTANSLTQAESTILGARETMRNTEQTVLQNGATSYMNVLRDTAILNLRKNNVTVLEEQLRQTRDRFKVGDLTRTDVAQAEASLAQARADFFTAQSNLQTSISTYRQVIGQEPKKLEPVRPIEKFLPRSLNEAIAVSQSEHPAIQASLHGVDAAQLQVKLVEGELYPTVGVTGTLTRRWAVSNVPGSEALTASVVGQVTVPLYEGGEVYARTRQAKETLGQQRLQTDVQREAVRALVVSTWGMLESSKAVIQAAQAQVAAAEIALNGVREEAKVGQRTTLDVLNAQQVLLNARVSLVTAQRDRVVNSYAVMAATGRLSASRIGLRVAHYDPNVHFEQVKDKWIGLRTPDGQ